MNRTAVVSAFAGGALWIQAALAQSLLSQAERLQPPAASSPAASSPAQAGGGYLGYTPVEGTDDGRGVQVESVKAGAPAAQGGLKDRDLITAVNGRKMTLAQFDDFLKTASPGQRLQLTVERDGRTQLFTVTLGTKPAPSAPAATPPGESSFASPSLTPPASTPPGSFSAPATPAEPATTPSLSSPGAPVPADSGAPSPAAPRDTESLPGAGPATTPAPDVPAPRSIQAQPLELGPPPGTAAQHDATGSPPSEPPASAPAGAASGGGPSLGITVVPLSEEARAQAGIPVRRGAMIANVRRGSPAEQAGLPVGAVIVRMDSREITSADDLVSAIKSSQPGQEVEVTYYDRSRLYRKLVRLAGAAEAGEGSSTAPPIGSNPGIGDGILRGGPGALGNRPMLRNLGQMAADAISRPPATSTVYDPSVVATLQNRVQELTEQMRQLEERIRALESRTGGAATTPVPLPSATTPALVPQSSSPPAAPSFGAPSGPGFGPALGGTGTTP